MRTHMKLINPHANEYYAEERQELQVKFAFVTETLPKEVKTLHNFVNCRDFLSDAIYWKQFKLKDIEIYGFKMNPLNIEQISPFMAIQADPSKLNQLEKNARIHENFYYVDRPEKNISLISLHEFAIRNPINISIASLMIKLLCVLDFKEPFKNQIDKLPKKEQGYLKEIGLPLMEEITRSGLGNYLSKDKLVWEKPDEIKKLDPYTLHDNLGIVSCFKSYSPNSNMKKYFLKLKKQVEAYEKSKHSSADPVYYSTTSTATGNSMMGWAKVQMPAAQPVNPVEDLVEEILEENPQPVLVNPALNANLNHHIQQQAAAIQADIQAQVQQFALQVEQNGHGEVWIAVDEAQPEQNG